MEPIKVLNSPMGYGKSSSMIQHMNNNYTGVRYLVVVTLKTEQDRYIKHCPKLNFKKPGNFDTTKSEDIRRLIATGENIVTTHALFALFDIITINMIKLFGYCLVMDEVEEIVKPLAVSKDIVTQLLSLGLQVDPKTGKASWDDTILKQSELKRREIDKQLSEDSLKCEEGYEELENNYSEPTKPITTQIIEEAKKGTIYYLNGCFVVWLMPIEAFQCFKDIFILTYLFQYSNQCMYFKSANIPYKCYSVEHKSNKYNIVDYTTVYDAEFRQKTKKLLNIIQDQSGSTANKFGNTNSLSKSWYTIASPKKKETLKKHLFSFFKNRTKSTVSDAMYTTYKDFIDQVQSNRYKNCFVPFNCKATNDYSDRHNLAYIVNVYYHPAILNFFYKQGVIVNQDMWATSELLQWIYRSAIRKGEEVTLYLPSKRMRKLLNDWLEGEDIYQEESYRTK